MLTPSPGPPQNINPLEPPKPYTLSPCKAGKLKQAGLQKQSQVPFRKARHESGRERAQKNMGFVVQGFLGFRWFRGLGFRGLGALKVEGFGDFGDFGVWGCPHHSTGNELT